MEKLGSKPIPIGVSNRHLHLSESDLHTLFGPGHPLTIKKELQQPGEFAAEETVDLVGPKGTIAKVRVLGPVRKQTQVEISFTDSFVLGVIPPVRDSGSVDGSPGLTLKGPNGELQLKQGVIAAKRHIHCTPEQAAELGVQNGGYVAVMVEGERGLIFQQVLVRVRDTFALEMHVDTDEANASGLKNGDKVYIVKQPGKSR